MLRITSSLYQQARTGLFEQMNNAYQTGRQLATGPGEAWNVSKNWLIQKERNLLNPRPRQRQQGPGRWNCFWCGQWVPAGGQQRLCPQGYEDRCVDQHVTLCPNCVGAFDQRFKTTATPKAAPPKTAPPAKPPVSPAPRTK